MKAMPLPCPPPRPFIFSTLQRGAVGILAAISLPIAILATVLVVDTGRLFMERRDLQKIADTAAVEAVSRLTSGNCAGEGNLPNTYANENAAGYGFGSAAGETLSTVCVGLATNPDTAVRAPDNSVPADQRRAVQVTVSRIVPASLILRAGSLFGVGGDVITLNAQAIAEKDVVEPWAEFSVGAQLLSLGNDRLLGTVLSAVGVSTDLTALSSAGLASAKVTPAGLLRALGITLTIDELKALSPAGLVQLVNTEVGVLGVDDLINLGAEVVSDSTLKANLGALGTAIAANGILGPATVQLFGTPSTPGLIRLGTGAENNPLGAALDAQINLGDLLSGGILAGAAGRGLVIPNASLLGLGTLSLGIVEPPTIAVGPVGTQAFNAQVRLHVNVDTNSTLLVGALLNALAVRIHLPITVDLTDARGTLTDIDCSVIPTTATVQVDSSVGNVCLGEMPPGALWSNSSSCTALVQDTDLVTAPLVGTLLRGKIALPALPETDTTPPLSIDGSYETKPNTLKLGQLFTDLGTQLTGLTGLTGLTLMTVLQPLLDTVGTALSALLSGLGIDLTRTDVQMRDISCGMPRLVN